MSPALASATVTAARFPAVSARHVPQVDPTALLRTPEQEELASIMRQFLAAASPPEQVRRQLAAGPLHGPGRPERPQDPGGTSRRDRLGHAAGDQLAQHRVQPADDLGAGPAQVTVALGPDLQHRRVIIGPHLLDTG